MTRTPIVMWFRHDLRIEDNAAFAAAAESGAPVLALYVLDDVSAGPWRAGGASRWWLGQSLSALRRTLSDRYGVQLVVMRGPADDVLAHVADEIGASAVFCSRDYEPWSIDVEQRVHRRLAACGAELKRFRGRVLFEPDRVKTQGGRPFQVFSAYWRAVSKLDVGIAIDAPPKISAWPKSRALDDAQAWAEITREPKWAHGFAGSWQPGAEGAQARLADFLDGQLQCYANLRDRPDLAATSKLSPHLHFGEISPRQVWHAARARAAVFPEASAGMDTFLKEIGWREFSYQLLFHWPELPVDPLRQEFGGFGWRDDPAALAAWQKGRTGYPIVDAGMRELWQTGWMHNRVRMIVASFLVKDLLVSWQQGEAWFWDCLVDADLAANAASWQWVAGSGADAAPYFRIFNPVKQGMTFDPDGTYVRQYVPELGKLENRYIHAPWTAPAEVLARANVKLGESYPTPIVDHAQARERALAAFAALKLKNAGGR